MTHNKNDLSISNPHDLGYKSMISKRQICVDVIQSCIDEDWAKEIDESYLEDKSTEFILPEYRLKKADKVFRMKIKNKEFYFYILHELQSTVDFHMPYRLLLYMVEIWRQIIDTKKEQANKKDFRLPVIIPIVLYNGKNQWTAKRNIKDILDHNGYFENLLPDFPYLLIDVNRYSKDFLKSLSNTVGAIFLLDQKYDIIELEERLNDALPGIKTFEVEAFQTFKNWFEHIICDHISPDKKKSFMKILEQASPKEADRMISNLYETIRDAQESIRHEERKKARHECEKVRHEERERVAISMLRRDLPLEAIVDVTELPFKEVIKLRKRVV